MARFNEILVGRYNRFLQKLLSMKGPVPSPQLASEITTTINLFSGAEHRYLESWALFQRSIIFAAVAAQVNAIRLRNPAGSNVIGVITLIQLATGAALDSQIAVTAGTAAVDFTTSNAPPLDTRDTRAGGSIIPSFTQAAAPAALTGANNIYVIPSMAGSTVQNLIQHEEQEIPLLPGSAIQIQGSTVNIVEAFAIGWRERFLEDSERT